VPRERQGEGERKQDDAREQRGGEGPDQNRPNSPCGRQSTTAR
jgi:hypothetical protein